MQATNVAETLKDMVVQLSARLQLARMNGDSEKASKLLAKALQRTLSGNLSLDELEAIRKVEQLRQQAKKRVFHSRGLC